MRPKEKSSPLKDKPLRQAGQSLDDEIFAKGFDGVVSFYFLALMMGVLITAEWLWLFIDQPRSPWMFTVVGAIVIVYSIYRIRKGVKELEPLQLARRGERAVGQFLELFREDGAKVVHDLVGEKFNVDHLLISGRGVFTIETKTYSKPQDGRIIFDGKNILVDGFDTESKLLVQARAEAPWVRKLVRDSTGKSLEVFPIIVFPGWFVESTREGKKAMLQ